MTAGNRAVERLLATMRKKEYPYRPYLDKEEEEAGPRGKTLVRIAKNQRIEDAESLWATIHRQRPQTEPQFD